MSALEKYLVKHINDDAPVNDSESNENKIGAQGIEKDNGVNDDGYSE